jgi:DNA replication and repair protein RecF
LALRRVRITALRCIAEADLALHPQRNYIYGPNGAGKTSALESVYLLGRGRSFRTRHFRRLVRHGSSGLAVFGEVETGSAIRRVGIAFDNGRLERKLEGQAAASGVELARIVPVHAIEPGSHELIQGGPSERRRFLDWGVFHVEHGYLEAWRRYRRLLGQRNAALKAAASNAEIATWTTQLLEAGAAVHAQREAYVADLARHFAAYGRSLLGSTLTLAYHSGWRADLSFERALAANEARDRAAGHSEVGPHRADLVIKLDGRRAQDEASRGQQKLAAAALVLAQACVLSAHDTAVSVVLVDDPAAELDASALAKLLGALDSMEAQIVFTALRPEALPASPESAVFHVEHGVLRAL